MSEIVDFLLARLAEDEAGAREAIGADDPHWRVIECAENIGQVLAADGCEEVAYVRRRGRHSVGVGWQTAHHIARHDPARVLAEIEAKRRIVGEYGSGESRPHRAPLPWPEGEVIAWECQECGRWCNDGPNDGDCPIDWRRPSPALRLLALPYADHPDYRQEWRP